MNSTRQVQVRKRTGDDMESNKQAAHRPTTKQVSTEENIKGSIQVRNRAGEDAEWNKTGRTQDRNRLEEGTVEEEQSMKGYRREQDMGRIQDSSREGEDTEKEQNRAGHRTKTDKEDYTVIGQE